jgi:dTDP-4-amino-4,6-dideoxygalactose transaminase
LKIPLMNLKRQNDALKEEYLQAIGCVIDRGAYILGEEVSRFEEEFAAFQGVRFCLGVSNGTTALHLALTACGVGPGDEVLTVPNSFVATAEAVAHCGATPVFVDVDPETLQMDPELAERAVTPRTRAILPVHLYGCPAPVDRLADLAARRGLVLVEDAAQAHGASLGGQRVGGFGRAAAFSFFPGKNLGALGDAGAVVTNDEALYRKMRLLRDHGAPRKYCHELVGFNYRMDAIKGATLRIKLRRLERWNALRRERAALYLKELEGTGLFLPRVPSGAEHVFHLFVVQTGRRDSLAAFLAERDIATGIHYPVPIHLQPAFAFLGLRQGDFPVAERAAERILSLPLCPEITGDEVREVCAAVRTWAASQA